jgi:hypothetical protein
MDNGKSALYLSLGAARKVILARSAFLRVLDFEAGRGKINFRFEISDFGALRVWALFRAARGL